jgi:RecG-like helicase
MRPIAFIVMFLFLIVCEVFAQQKEDFVMYAKDSVIEIKKTDKKAVAIVDSIPFDLTADQKQVLVNIISEEIQSIDFINNNNMLSLAEKKLSINDIKKIKLNQIKEHLSPQQFKLFLSWRKKKV